MTRKNPAALSQDEIDFLKSSKVDDLIRNYTSRNHENIGVWASAYKKVASAARAEREALEEVTLLALARGDAQSLTDQQNHIAQLQRRTQALEVENRELTESITRAIAAPSMAVHSSD